MNSTVVEKGETETFPLNPAHVENILFAIEESFKRPLQKVLIKQPGVATIAAIIIVSLSSCGNLSILIVPNTGPRIKFTFPTNRYDLTKIKDQLETIRIQWPSGADTGKDKVEG